MNGQEKTKTSPWIPEAQLEVLEIEEAKKEVYDKEAKMFGVKEPYYGGYF